MVLNVAMLLCLRISSGLVWVESGCGVYGRWADASSVLSEQMYLMYLSCTAAMKIMYCTSIAHPCVCY